MRGRTNVNGVGELAVNGDVKRFEVAEGESVVSGDFVEMIYNPQVKKILQKSGSVNFIINVSVDKYLAVMAGSIVLFNATETIEVIGIYNLSTVYGIAKISENLFFADCENKMFKFSVSGNQITVLEEHESDFSCLAKYSYTDIFNDNGYIIRVYVTSGFDFYKINPNDFSVIKVSKTHSYQGTNYQYYRGRIGNKMYYFTRNIPNASTPSTAVNFSSYFSGNELIEEELANTDLGYSDSNKHIYPQNYLSINNRYFVYLRFYRQNSSFINSYLCFYDTFIGNIVSIQLDDFWGTSSRLFSAVYSLSVSEIDNNVFFVSYNIDDKNHIFAVYIDPVSKDISIKSHMAETLPSDISWNVYDLNNNMLRTNYGVYNMISGKSEIYSDLFVYENDSLAEGSPKNIVKRYTGAINPFGIAKETGRSGQIIDVFVPPENPK